MFNADDFYKNIERRQFGILSTYGEGERKMSQHLGHMMNHEFKFNTKVYDEIMGNVERLLTGQKKHGFEQNKKTELEKLQEKGTVNG